jgi:hypothetical protein
MRFEGPAWGTHEFLRGRAQCPAGVGSGNRPSPSTLITCLVQPWAATVIETAGVVERQRSERSDCNDYEKRENLLWRCSAP